MIYYLLQTIVVYHADAIHTGMGENDFGMNDFPCFHERPDDGLTDGRIDRPSFD